MDKVLLVVGSMRNGNSLKIANELNEYFKSNNFQTNLVTPGNQKISLCNGCLKCDEIHKCISEDDMTGNLKLFDESNYIVFITPTRFSLLSGDIKIFIDRLNPLCQTCDFTSKKFIAISIGQTNENEKIVDQATASLINFADNCNMETIFKYNFYNCLGETDLKSNEINEMMKELDKKVRKN